MPLNDRDALAGYTPTRAEQEAGLRGPDRDRIAGQRYDCVFKIGNQTCGNLAIDGSAYCDFHQSKMTQAPEKKIAEKGLDRSPVESDAIHLLKQAVRQMENGKREAAGRYVAAACLLMVWPE